MKTVAILALLPLLQAAPGKAIIKEIAKPSTLYASAQGISDCAAAVIIQQKKLQENPRWLMFSEDRKKQLGVGTPQVCIDNEVASLTVGVTIEISSNPGPCAEPTKKFIRVRVTSGKDKDAIGCLTSDDVRDSVSF